ncbi:MAG: hypothetical protein AAF517_01325, partial [Planctomycetota bacterium]
SDFETNRDVEKQFSDRWLSPRFNDEADRIALLNPTAPLRCTLPFLTALFAVLAWSVFYTSAIGKERVVMLCFIGLVYWVFFSVFYTVWRKESRRPVLLSFDKKTRVLSLPMDDVEAPLDDVVELVHFRWIGSTGELRQSGIGVVVKDSSGTPATYAMYREERENFCHAPKMIRGLSEAMGVPIRSEDVWLKADSKYRPFGAKPR